MQCVFTTWYRTACNCGPPICASWCVSNASHHNVECIVSNYSISCLCGCGYVCADSCSAETSALQEHRSLRSETRECAPRLCWSLPPGIPQSHTLKPILTNTSEHLSAVAHRLMSGVYGNVWWGIPNPLRHKFNVLIASVLYIFRGKGKISNSIISNRKYLCSPKSRKRK